jgi:hypothetical protein
VSLDHGGLLEQAEFENRDSRSLKGEIDLCPLVWRATCHLVVETKDRAWTEERRQEKTIDQSR